MQKKALSWLVAVSMVLSMFASVPIKASAIVSPAAVFSDSDLDHVYFIGDTLSFNLSGLPVGTPPSGIPAGTTLRVSLGIVDDSSTFSDYTLFNTLSNGMGDGTGFYSERTLQPDGTLSSDISGTIVATPTPPLGIVAVKLYVYNGSAWQNVLQGYSSDYIPLSEDTEYATVGLDGVMVMPDGVTSSPVIGSSAQSTENLRSMDISFTKTIAASVSGTIAFTGLNLLDNSTELAGLDSGLVMDKVTTPALGAISQFTMGIDDTAISYLASKGATISVTSAAFDGLSAGEFNAAAADAGGGAVSGLAFNDATDTVSFTVNHFSNYILTQQDPSYLSFSVSKTDVTTEDGNDGSITVTSVSGGGGTYEYSFDNGGTWGTDAAKTALTAGTYDVKIRDAANITNVSSAQQITILQPVTPAAPAVTRDDSANTVSGMTAGMEYDLDSAGYVAYNSADFSAIDFSGNHTLLVRVAAAGINPAGAVTTLTFTINPPELDNNYLIGTGTNIDAATDGSGNVYAVYENSGAIYFAKNRQNPEAIAGGGSDANAALAVEADGTAHITFERSGSIIYAKRTTGGVWSITTVESGSNPDIDVDGSGYAHIVCQGNTDGDSYVELVYANNSSGSFSSAVFADGWYDSGSGWYFYSPKIKIDASGYYHIVYEIQAWGGRASWSEKQVGITTNAPTGSTGQGGYSWNGGVSIPKNALALKGVTGDTYIVYNAGGVLYRDSVVSGTWNNAAFGAYSAPAIASCGSKTDFAYVDSGVRYAQDDGSGFSGPGLIDASGSAPAVAVDSTYSYIYYEKGGSVYLATDENVAPPFSADLADDDLDNVYFAGNNMGFNLAGLNVLDGQTVRVAFGTVSDGGAFTPAPVVGGLTADADGVQYFTTKTVAGGTFSSEVSGTIQSGLGLGVTAVKVFYESAPGTWTNVYSALPQPYMVLKNGTRMAYTGIALPAGVTSSPVLGAGAQDTENLYNINIAFVKTIDDGITGRVSFSGLDLISNKDQLASLASAITMQKEADPGTGFCQKFTLGVDTGTLVMLGGIGATVSVTSSSFNGCTSAGFAAASLDVTGGLTSGLAFNDATDTVSFTVNHFSNYTLTQKDPSYIVGIPSGNFTISEDGNYQLANGYSGIITIAATAGTVELMGSPDGLTDADTAVTVAGSRISALSLTIENLNIKAPNGYNGIDFYNAGNFAHQLFISGINTVTGDNGWTGAEIYHTNTFYGAGIRVPDGVQLTIDKNSGLTDAQAQLTVTGGNQGAGLGGGGLWTVNNTGSGVIIINGGTITATGGPWGAGIGGGYAGTEGTTIINGGVVTANGYWATGIGGGHSGGGNQINITGGSVTARGSERAAIESDNISITGGTVTAYGGAATGYSVNGINCGELTIASSACVTSFGQTPAINAVVSATGHTAYMLNFALDNAVTNDTPITITKQGTPSEEITLTLPAGYSCFATTVGGANTYRAQKSDGSKYIVASADSSRNFIGTLAAPSSSIDFVASSLVSPPVCEIGTVGYDSIDDALSSVTNAQTIKLLSDITYGERIWVGSSYCPSLTLDLNGYELEISNVEVPIAAIDGYSIHITDDSVSGGGILKLNTTSDDSAPTGTSAVGTGSSVVIDSEVTTTITSTAENGKGVSAYNGGSVEIGNASVTVPISGSSTSVYADGVGSSISITGDVNGGWAGVATTNGTVSVTGNVTTGYSGSGCGVRASGGTISITGNVSSTGGGNYGAYADNGGTITVTGNVTSGSVGTAAYNGSHITIDGVISYGVAYIEIGSYSNYLNQGSYAVSTTKTGYRTYTDGDSTVWVKAVYSTDATLSSLTAADITLLPSFASSVTSYSSSVSNSVNSAAITAQPTDSNASVEINGTADTSKTISLNEGSNTITVLVTAEDKATTKTYTITITRAYIATLSNLTASGITLIPSFDGGTINYSASVDNSVSTTTIAAQPSSSSSTVKINGSNGTSKAISLSEGSNTITVLVTAGDGTTTKTYTITITRASLGGGGGGTSAPVGQQVTISTPDGKTGVTGTLTNSGDKTQVSIGGTQFGQIADTKQGAVIPLEIASVIFDPKAINTINGDSTAGNVILTVEKIDPAKLTSEQQKRVGDRPVYDFTLTKGGKQISNFGGGHAKISIPYTLKAGENPNQVVIYYLADDGSLKTVRGHYDATSKCVVFETEHLSKYAVGYNHISFNDVTSDAWYYDAVNFIAARGITSGTGTGAYSPDMPLTRGQFIVMLMNAYGISPDSAASGTVNFVDAGSTYYTNYLLAAKSLGIVSGVGNNMFAPEQVITRQEMFVMLYNALKVIGELPEASGTKQLSDFSDADQIASWAQETMNVLVKGGAISGNNGMLNPTSSTTRAEMAQMLYNLLSK